MNAAVFFRLMVAAAMFLCSSSAWAEEYTVSQIKETGMCSPTRSAKISYKPAENGRPPVTVYDCYDDKLRKERIASPRPVSPPLVERENGLIRNRHVLVLDETYRLCNPKFFAGKTPGTSSVICSQDDASALLEDKQKLWNRMWHNLAACIVVSVPAGGVDQPDIVDQYGGSLPGLRSNRFAFHYPVTIVPDAQCRVNQSAARLKKPGRAVIARSNGAVTKKPGSRRAMRR